MIANKSDVKSRQDADVAICATSGDGLEKLVATIRDALVSPDDLADDGPWLFDERLIDL